MIFELYLHIVASGDSVLLSYHFVFFGAQFFCNFLKIAFQKRVQTLGFFNTIFCVLSLNFEISLF